MEAIQRVSYNQEIAFIFLLISFFFFAILKAFYWKTTKLLILSAFSKRYTNEYLREENVFTERVNVITFLILVIYSSLWVFKLKNENSIYSFGLIIFLISTYYLIKYFNNIFFRGCLFHERSL